MDHYRANNPFIHPYFAFALVLLLVFVSYPSYFSAGYLGYY